jgi:hypothetical protein
MHMHNHRGLRVLKFLVIGVVIVSVVGWGIVYLWNWLVPAIFGWRTISFWQAVGLFVLARILVGGFGGGHRRHRGWKHRMHRRWDGMTSEEREKFREGMRGRCRFTSSTPERRAE